MQNNTFSTLFVGQNLIHLVTVDSTNDYLKNIASNSEPLAEGTVIMAEHQFKGRGQHGGNWISESGKNLMFSLYLKPTFLPIDQQFLLNMVVSLGINQSLSKILDQDLSIKWPNDVYYKNKKLGGVLIENTLNHNGIKQSVIGIGININQQNFNEELAEKATSIYNILHQEYDLRQLLTDICSAIEAAYLRLRAGRFEEIKGLYLENLYRYQIPASYRRGGKIVRGTIVDVEETGELILAIDGAKEKFNFKEIEFIHD